MTYRIAICEDSPADGDYVNELVCRWARQAGVMADVARFASSEQFLFRYAQDKCWDILLLDIEMGGMDGVSLARRLRKEGDPVQVVFLTGFPDFLAEGYEVSALHYLMKPIRPEKLFSVLDRAVGLLGRAEPTLVLQGAGEALRLKISQIQYVEAFAHSVTIVTDTEPLSLRIPISQLEQRLPEQFLRCHRSYLVNLQHIAKLSKTQVTLDSGVSLPLSRSAAGLVHRAFVRHYSGECHETV